jgi:uncharacterized protein DUF1236
MNKSFLTIAALFVATLPYTAHAQGTIRGVEEGAAAGHRAAGPLGAIVGGTIGAATGTVGGILGVEERPRFREYVIREHHPSFAYEGDVRVPSFGYEGDVRVGAVLPPRGVALYAIPRGYHVRPGYRYAIANDRPVIVESRSRRIVEIIE